jgi:hypothetical protein
MTVQNTDVFVVSRGGTLHSVTAANANGKIQDTDLLVVRRGTTTYKITGKVFKAAAFQDGDLFIVNRNHKSYKATGAVVKAILQKAPIIQVVTLAEDDAAGAAFTSQSFTATITMTEPGMPVATHNLKAWVEGTLNGVAGARLYLKFNAAGAVSDLQSADPGWVQTTDQATPKLTFPATLPSGKKPDEELPAGTTITVEAQATNAAGTVTKVSNIIVPSRPAPPKPGDAMGGGFFAGQINDGGVIYNLIVAPKVSGTLHGEISKIAWGTSTRALNGVYINKHDGRVGMGDANRKANYAGQYPLIEWVETNPTGPNKGHWDPTNSVGTGIGGFNDWYIPSVYEAFIVFFGLKGQSAANSTSTALAELGANGTNPYSVAPYTPNTPFTATLPGVTTVPAFITGSGAEAFPNYFEMWTSTECDPGNKDSAYFISMWDGDMHRSQKTASNRGARAIRRVPA